MRPLGGPAPPCPSPTAGRDARPPLPHNPAPDRPIGRAAFGGAARRRGPAPIRFLRLARAEPRSSAGADIPELRVPDHARRAAEPEAPESHTPIRGARPA